MKKLFEKKVFLPILILLLTVFTVIASFGNAIPSSAAGTVDIFMDANSWVPVGNTFTLTIRVEADIEAMVNLEISYNGDNLECVGAYAPNDSGAFCNDNGSLIMIVTSSFKTSHRYECTFKVKKSAATTFKATVIECGTLDAIELPTPSLEKTVNGYVPTPTPTQAPTPTPTIAPTASTTAPTQTLTPTQTQTPSYTPFNPSADPSATPANPDEFMDNGEIRYIAEDFEESNVTIPEGFEKRSVKYKDANIFGAQNSSRVNLIYATDVLGQNGKFYIYIEKLNTLLPYLEIPYGNNNYVFTILSEKPEHFTDTTIDLAENTLNAYTTSNENYKDFIVLYGFKVGGELSYYLYDTVEGTLQRCVDHTILENIHNNGEDENNSDPTNVPSQNTAGISTSKPTSSLSDKNDNNFKINKKTILFAIILVCVLAIIIAAIIIIVRSKKIAKRYNGDDDDEYYNEDEFMSPQLQPTPSAEENYAEPDEPVEETQDNNTDESASKDDDDEILQLRND